MQSDSQQHEPTEADNRSRNFLYKRREGCQEKLFARSIRNKALIDKRTIELIAKNCFFNRRTFRYENNISIRRLNNFLNFYDGPVSFDVGQDDLKNIIMNLSLLSPQNRSKTKNNIHLSDTENKFLISKERHGPLDFIDNFNMSDDLLNKLLTSSLKDGIIDKERYEKIIAKTSKTINRNNKMKVV